MAVPKHKRNQSPFEAEHHFFRLRDDITLLMLTDFGFSSERYEKAIERYRRQHEHDENVDAIVARFRKKSDSFNRWFIDKECDAVLSLMREIQVSFSKGNGIYPIEGKEEIKQQIRAEEIIERRLCIDKAISTCYALKQEIQYIIRTLPVDMDKYLSYAERIDRQISLYKGVRRSDNGRFLNTSTNFANVNSNGNASTNNASNSNGVRPDLTAATNETLRGDGGMVEGGTVPAMPNLETAMSPLTS